MLPGCFSLWLKLVIRFEGMVLTFATMQMNTIKHFIEETIISTLYFSNVFHIGRNTKDINIIVHLTGKISNQLFLFLLEKIVHVPMISTNYFLFNPSFKHIFCSIQVFIYVSLLSFSFLCRKKQRIYSYNN